WIPSRLVLSVAILSQVHIGMRDFRALQQRLKRDEALLSIARSFQNHVKNQLDNNMKSDLDYIQATAQVITQHLERDQTYAQLQNTIGKLHVSVGKELISGDTLHKLTTAELSEQLVRNITTWETALFRGIKPPDTVMVKHHPISKKKPEDEIKTIAQATVTPESPITSESVTEEPVTEKSVVEKSAVSEAVTEKPIPSKQMTTAQTIKAQEIKDPVQPIAAKNTPIVKTVGYMSHTALKQALKKKQFAEDKTLYSVLIFAHKNTQYSKEKFKLLLKDKFPPFIMMKKRDGVSLWTIHMGVFRTQEEAVQWRVRLQEKKQIPGYLFSAPAHFFVNHIKNGYVL
ncbi:hypothetical protein ACQZV8_18750, partial [Magnetococcales bacterium HHB-1]